MAQYIMRNVFNIKKDQVYWENPKGDLPGQDEKGKRQKELWGLFGRWIHRRHYPAHSRQVFSACQVFHLKHVANATLAGIRIWGARLVAPNRGMRAKAEQMDHITDTAEKNTEAGIDIIDISSYQPKNVPSLTWCECIKKIWKQDPLICPKWFPLA